MISIYRPPYGNSQATDIANIHFQSDWLPWWQHSVFPIYRFDYYIIRFPNWSISYRNTMQHLFWQIWYQMFCQILKRYQHGALFFIAYMILDRVQYDNWYEVFFHFPLMRCTLWFRLIIVQYNIFILKCPGNCLVIVTFLSRSYLDIVNSADYFI